MWHDSKGAAYWYVPVQQTYILDDDRNYFKNVIVYESEVWLAEQSGQIEGVMALKGDLLDQLFVRVENWGQGIGTSLLPTTRIRAGCPVCLDSRIPLIGFYADKIFKYCIMDKINLF